MKQEDRKKQVINQTFDLRPDRTIKCGVTTNQIAANDQGEVWKKKLSVIHAGKNNRIYEVKFGLALMCNPQHSKVVGVGTMC